MSVFYKDLKEAFEKRLREIYKMGMPRAIEAQKINSAKIGFFSDARKEYFESKLDIFVKNIEYLKIKHDMSDYKMGDFISMQTGIIMYKTSHIGLLVNRKRLNLEKIMFHAHAVGFSFDIDPLYLVSSDVEFGDSNGSTKKFWK